jgi:drug/metabolite transporter (DMT)-like permease
MPSRTTPSPAGRATKLAIADCPPLILLTTRFLLAGILMLGAAAMLRVSLQLSGQNVLLFAMLGIANQAAYLGLSYLGLRTISSGLSALIISANPVLTAVLAASFLGERMTWRKAAGLLLGVGGVAFVVESRLGGGVDHPVGIALTIAALTSLVGGTIVFKKFVPTSGLWVGTGVQSLSAGIALLPFAFTFDVGDIVPTRVAHTTTTSSAACRMTAFGAKGDPLGLPPERHLTTGDIGYGTSICWNGTWCRGCGDRMHGPVRPGGDSRG